MQKNFYCTPKRMKPLNLTANYFHTSLLAFLFHSTHLRETCPLLSPRQHFSRSFRQHGKRWKQSSQLDDKRLVGSDPSSCIYTGGSHRKLAKILPFVRPRRHYLRLYSPFGSVPFLASAR